MPSVDGENSVSSAGRSSAWGCRSQHRTSARGPWCCLNPRRGLDEVTLEAPGALALRSLANRIARYAPHDGVFPLRLPGTYALRVGGVITEPVHATLGASLCLVAQGSKAMMLGSDVLEYDASRMLVFAVDLPVSGQVTRASQRQLQPLP